MKTQTYSHEEYRSRVEFYNHVFDFSKPKCDDLIYTQLKFTRRVQAAIYRKTRQTVSIDEAHRGYLLYQTCACGPCGKPKFANYIIANSLEVL